MRNVTKSLRFPLAGIARDGSYREATYPQEGRAYPTPMAQNVIGECAFSERLRGGSRPGLSVVSGATESSTGRWLWPNGEAILWPTAVGEPTSHMIFAEVDSAKMPDGSTIVLQHPTAAVYRNRLVKSSGSMWMASATGDFGNFDFGRDAEQPTRAVAGNLALAGKEGEPITAICPIADSRLYIATRRNLVMISGEPTSALMRVSDVVGIISSNAWCNADGTLFFIGPNGLYAAADGSPRLLSQKIPTDLKGLSSATLVYDAERRGIHILGTATDWFYDIENNAFWPLSYPAAIRPTMGGLANVDGVNTIVFRCADGSWRTWNDSSALDGTTPVSSKVVIGPFKCGAADHTDGMIDSVCSTLAVGSASVGVAIVTAHSAEAVVSACASATDEFTIGSGWNPVFRPRRRGAWCAIVLSSTGKWAYESLEANVKTLGGLRP